MTTHIRIGQIRGTGYPVVRVIERQRGHAGEARTLYVIEYLTGASAGHRETRTRAYVASLALRLTDDRTAEDRTA